MKKLILSSNFAAPRTREESRRAVDKWYKEEDYPQYADKLRYAREIFWDWINMEDVECFLEGNDNVDLSKVDSVRYMDNDEFSAIEDEGYEGGYIITYKNGEVKAYAWRPYPYNLDSLDEVEI